MPNIHAAIAALQALEDGLVRTNDLSAGDTRDVLLVLVWLALAELGALPGKRV